MKLAQFRALIREEVEKILTEATAFDVIYDEIRDTLENPPSGLPGFIPMVRSGTIGTKDFYKLAPKAYDKYGPGTTFNNAIAALVKSGNVKFMGKDKFGLNKYKVDVKSFV